MRDHGQKSRRDEKSSFTDSPEVSTVIMEYLNPDVKQFSPLNSLIQGD